MTAHQYLLLAGCLCGAFCAQDGTANDTPEQLTQQAQTAFEQADIVAAMTLYRQAAEAGHAAAQTRLAYMLDNSEANEEAVLWYRKAAAQGNTDGMYGLARMYAAGEGVAQDRKTAVGWYTRAAQQGHAPSIRVLALAYEKGELDLDINYAQAVSWLNAGVAAQDVWAIRRLARAWRQGELGQRIDLEQATFLENRLARITAQPGQTH